MSLDYSSYVGPYAICLFDIVDTLRSLRTCSNRACKQHGSWAAAPFCPDCGHPIQVTDVPAQGESVNAWAVQEAIHEALHFPGGDSMDALCRERREYYWLPNRCSDGLHIGHYDPREKVFAAVVAPGLIQREVDWFAAAFAAELTALRQAYGADRVHVAWGVLAWIS